MLTQTQNAEDECFNLRRWSAYPIPPLAWVWMNNANRWETLGILNHNQACAIARITLSILCPSSDAAA